MNVNYAYFHLPGLYEFYDFYREFLPVYFNHKEFFFDWCKIGSIYGAPKDCLWSGGRTSDADASNKDVLDLIKEYKISARLTFSNSLLNETNLKDLKCNNLCNLFNDENNGIIIYSDLLLDYIKEHYPKFYFVSSTTKVIINFEGLLKELNNKDFKYVVPDFRLNKAFDKFESLNQSQKNKMEFLCNECCYIGCKERKRCYENVSRKNLGLEPINDVCKAPDLNYGYSFSKTKKNPSFISLDDIKNKYMPLGFSNFKIEGRGLGSALLLEFILYYMTKPEYQINVRELLYLDNMLDLF